MGGRDDKVGNEYEQLWVVKQALHVLEGVTHKSILWEALGDDELGVDLWVERIDGTREAHQCKRKNRNEGSWSLPDLATRGVFHAAKSQLERDTRHRYVFVSADRAPDLAELASRARTCSDDIDKFCKYQLDTTHRRDSFDYLCSRWKLVSKRDRDVRQALDWLQRITCRLFDLETNEHPDVESLARFLAQGDAAQIIDALGRGLKANFGNEIYADFIRKHLRKTKLPPRNLADDPSLSSSIERLRTRFVESIEPLLIDGDVLHRPEVAKLRKMIEQEDGPRLIWLHGNAGYGKSGVLYELVRCLEQEGVPYLPVRLDRQVPTRNPDYWGRKVCNLPASPAASLRALAGQRKSVLFLDQIDAVRWSGSHSSDAWDVCKETMAEAFESTSMRVVVVCRTFELQDPAVQHWKRRRTEHSEAPLKDAACLVEELPEAEIARVTSRKGVDLATMPPRQKALLKTPLGLYLWCEVCQDSEACGGSLSTGTALMRAFWKDRWKSLTRMSVSREDAETVLGTLVEYMDQKGTHRVPSSVASPKHQDAIDALCALNVLTQDSKNIVFAHQGYVDHLIADRVRHEAGRGGRQPIDWVRAHDQSLFRRDQLRQLLTLLRDDDPPLYLNTIHGILSGEGIRFHLKHLVLRLLGTWDVALDGEVDLLVDLYRQPQWCWHVIQEVLWVGKSYFNAFFERNILQAQLASGDESQISLALHAIRGMNTRFNNVIDSLLGPYWTAGEPWPVRIRFVMPHSVENDTVKMFGFRLAQASATHGFPYFSEKWAKESPDRCLKLTRAYIRSYITRCRAYVKTGVEDPPKWELTGKVLRAPISAACRASPIKAWTMLMPYAEEIARLRRLRRSREPGRASSANSTSNYHYRAGLSRASAFLRSLVVAAGQTLVRYRPRKFVELADRYVGTKSLTIRRVLLAVAGRGGRPLADLALGWLCDRPEFLRAGPRRDSCRWMPAYGTIRRLSPICSDRAYHRLENAILAYREPDELASCREKLERSKRGYPIRPNRVGLAQNTLLAALPNDRMSAQAKGAAGVWHEKFGPPVFSKKRPVRFRAVVSPIPQNRLHLVSDRHWLKIIKRSWSRDRSWNMSDNADVVMGASAERFAADLAEMAKRQPRRFATLALRIPESAGPEYMGRILGNLVDATPPPPGSPDAAMWTPVTQEQIERLMNRIGYSPEYGVATGFCDIIKARPATMWSDAVLERLARYAVEHPHPGPEDGYPEEHKLTMTEWNCVRGRAAHAVTALLFEQPEILKRMLPVVERLVRDPHPAVRLAAVGTCGPILNIDRDLAVRLFLEACTDDDGKIAAEQHTHEFIRCARLTHWPALVPLIQRMIDSTHPEAAQRCVAWMVVTGIEAGHGVSHMRRYLQGPVAHRMGCGVVAVALAEEMRFEAVCREILLCLFDDESKDVRHESASIFRHHNLYERSGFETFAERYIHSHAFLDEPWGLLRGLASYGGSAVRFAGVILEVCAVITSDRTQRAGHVWDHMAISELGTVLLRLYEQSQDRGDRRTQVRCLDAWDALLERGIGSVRDQLAALDS